MKFPYYFNNFTFLNVVTFGCFVNETKELFEDFLTALFGKHDPLKIVENINIISSLLTVLIISSDIINGFQLVGKLKDLTSKHFVDGGPNGVEAG